jgi:hypothetical protein
MILLPQALDTLDGCGLAGAVGTDHAEDFPLVDFNGYIVHRNGRTIDLTQVLDLDDGFTHQFEYTCCLCFGY